MADGAASLARRFWLDMMVVGTAVNLAAGMAALLLFLNDAPAWSASLVFLLPVPYNLWLTARVWTAAAGHPAAGAYRLSAVCWLVVATFI